MPKHKTTYLRSKHNLLMKFGQFMSSYIVNYLLILTLAQRLLGAWGLNQQPSNPNVIPEPTELLSLKFKCPTT